MKRLLKEFTREHDLHQEGLSDLELSELYELVEEIAGQGFHYSGDLSNYITRQKLGYKYPNISGVVTMKANSNTWTFKGGFPANIYRIVCTILNLSSKGSRARVVRFRSYASMQ